MWIVMKKILLLAIVLMTSGCTIAQKQAWNAYKLTKSLTSEDQQWITKYDKVYFKAEDSSNLFWLFGPKDYSEQEEQFCQSFKQDEWINSINTNFINNEPSCALLKNSDDVKDGLLIQVRTKHNFWSRYWYVEFIDINSQDVLASTDFIQSDPAKLNQDVIDNPIDIYRARVAAVVAREVNAHTEKGKLQSNVKNKLQKMCEGLFNDSLIKECLDTHKPLLND